MVLPQCGRTLSKSHSLKLLSTSRGANNPSSFESLIQATRARSEEHTSELQSRPHISYAVFCLKKKKNKKKTGNHKTQTKNKLVTNAKQ